LLDDFCRIPYGRKYHRNIERKKGRMSGIPIERKKEGKWKTEGRRRKMMVGSTTESKKERKYAGRNCPTLLCLMISVVFHMVGSTIER